MCHKIRTEFYILYTHFSYVLYFLFLPKILSFKCATCMLKDFSTDFIFCLKSGTPGILQKVVVVLC